MSRDSRQQGGRDLFSCSLTGWRLLQEIAIVGGWKPQGTTYLSRNEKLPAVALHDYEPGDSADLKCVDRDDAIAWARSLDLVKDRPDFLTLVQPTADADPQGDALLTLIAEFAQYAYGGSFGFVRHTSARE
jgi:hypothetical protein